MASAQQQPEFIAFAQALRTAMGQLRDATQAAWSTGNPAEALANAVPYMQAFGHVVVAWLWLDVALAAAPRAAGGDAAATGRVQAAQYFYRYESPKIGAWLQVAAARDQTCARMPEDAF